MSAKLLTNGCWTWFNWPVAVYSAADSAIYHGWITTAGDVRVGKYSTSYQLEQQPAVLHAALQPDDHANPAVLRLASGKILACYGVHNGNSYCRTSTNASDVRTWNAEVTVNNTVEEGYALIAQTNDANSTIWWFFRRGSTNPRPRHYRVSTNDGASWATAVSLFSVSGARPYMLICQSPTDGKRIDLLVSDSQPNEVSTNSVYHFYMVVDSGGTWYTLYTSNGTSIGAYNLDGSAHSGSPPALPLGPSDITKIYDGTTNRSWIWDIAWVNGVLQVGYVVFTTTTTSFDTHQYCRATLSGGTWSTEAICYAGDSHTAGTVGRVPQWIYPDASTTESNYSGGLRLDRNTADRAYVGKKFGDGDVRIEQWDKSGGTWGYTSTVSGVTGKVNARPFIAEGRSPTTVQFWSGTYTSFISYSTDVWTDPAFTTWAVKTSSPVWTPSNAPAGSQAYWLLAEGTGTTTKELVSGYSAPFIGSPTWGSNALGPTLSGFSTTIAVNSDGTSSALAAAAGSAAGYPRYLWAVWSNTNTTTGQYIILFGNSTSTNDMWGLTVNAGASGQVGYFFRDHSGGGPNGTVSNAAGTDGNIHLLMMLSTAANVHTLYLDGVSVASSGGTHGTSTFQNLTLGAIRRNGTQSNPFLGTLIAAGWGLGAPDPLMMYNDLVPGQFGGTRALLITGRPAALLMGF